MHKLLDINESSTRDLSMHYSGAVFYDQKEEDFLLVDEVDGNQKTATIHYRDRAKKRCVREVSLKYVQDSMKAVSLDDGYINLNGYALFLERSIDRRYKKTTTIGNTSVTPLGNAYIRYHKKRVKQELDAYTVLKAMKQQYYNYKEAIQRTSSAFSVALSPSLAIVKQPVKDGLEPLHVVYNSVYIGEIAPDTGKIEFKDDFIRELVIKQLNEVGYEAA